MIRLLAPQVSVVDLVLRAVIVYGVNPVREALRGPREVQRIWAVRGDWSGAPVAHVAAREIAALCGSDAHQGVCAQVEDYRYADAAELLALPDPFLVALDEVTDPQNLGAVCRTAEVAGATGVILTIKAINELHRSGGRYALVSLCIGGGQGMAAIIERV